MLELSGQLLSLEQIAAVAAGRLNVRLSSAARERVAASRALVDRVIEEGRVVYGINTGFGKLSEVRIAPADLEALQLNLVRSHSCGLGRPLSEPETRAMMLLRANVLTLGYSGCRTRIIETLLEMLERGVHPVIPEKGSVGASGDLAPLAHLALSMIGEGECWYRGERITSAAALRSAGLEPVRLGAKEGLALLNGTQAMGAVGALALYRGLRVAGVGRSGRRNDAGGAARYPGGL